MTEACEVCGNSDGNRVHRVHEQMFALGDPFDYLECGACGCLQLLDVPASLDRYYPPEYHSLISAPVVQDPPPIAFLKRCRAAHVLQRPSLIGAAVARAFGIPPYYEWLQKSRVRLDYSVLDVGSGTGGLLCALAREGFRSLTGVDPYLDRDLDYANGVRLLKRELSDVTGAYDWILLNHSFEHIPDSRGVLRRVYNLLKPDRFALIRIPVAGSWAWRHYGEHWVQLDAPRHLILHTEKSMRLLAAEVGFQVQSVEHDSTDFTFWMSEQYAKGTHPGGFTNITYNEAQLVEARTRAAELNRRGEGDQACFYLFKP
jgi:SAM-dependent methyltransferase